MSRERLDELCEWGILALVVTILLFGPLAFGAVNAVEFTVIQWLTAGVLCLWALRLWIQSRPKLLWPPICWAVMAFMLYAIGRYFTSDVEYLARYEVVRVITYAFLFFAILNNLHRQELTTVIVFTLVFLAMVVAGYAIFQFATGSDRVWHLVKPYPNRGSGTYICPNHLGGFLEMVLPLGLAYTLAGRLKPVTRIIIGYASLVMLAGIVVTVSRGTWLATGVALLVLFGVLTFQRRYRIPALAMLAALLIGAIFFVPRSLSFQKRAKDLVTAENRISDGLRFSMWQPAFRMWQEHPVWGVGPNHFDVRFGGYRPERVQIRPDRVHNDYLNTLADWGVVGFGLVLSAWLLLAVSLPRMWRTVRVGNSDFGGKGTSNKMAFVLGAGAALVAILAHSMVDFNLHIPANAILVVTLMALLTSHARFATDRYWYSVNLPIRSVATLLIAPAVVLFILLGLHRFSEARILSKAAREDSFSPESLSLLKQAFTHEPRNSRTAFAIAETLRVMSLEGGDSYEDLNGVNYATLAEQAADYYRLSTRLNPWHGPSWAGLGWSLDWLKKQDQSRAAFTRALQVEPNNFWIINMFGMHQIELGNFAAARMCFERSLRLETELNGMARAYLIITNERLTEFAGDDLATRLRRALGQQPSPSDSAF